MQLPGATHPHRVLLQLPDHFDPARPCLVVAPVSGSRGIYGAVALGGAWGLPRGCAVVYTDKGAGSDHYDFSTASGTGLDGLPAGPGQGRRAWEPPPAAADAVPLVGIKHAHSGDHPEADWGRHVLQSLAFALAVLEQQFDDLDGGAMTVIGAALSNGGGAVLRALELDGQGHFDAVLAVAPNITVPGVPHLFEYAVHAALMQPCVLADPERAAGWPLGTINPLLAVAGQQRCAALAQRGLIAAGTPDAAYQALRAAGLDDAALTQSALMTLGDVWRSIVVIYASAYARSSAYDMPCGYQTALPGEDGRPRAARAAERAGWWAASAGVVPGAGVVILDGPRTGADAAFNGLACLHGLLDDEALRAEWNRTRARGRIPDIPVIVVHGSMDGLIPVALSARPWVDAVRKRGAQQVTLWTVDHAQHFDSILGTPGIQGWFVPLLPYAHAALDALWAHHHGQAGLPSDHRFETQPSGAGQQLQRSHLGLHAQGRSSRDFDDR